MRDEQKPLPNPFGAWLDEGLGEPALPRLRIQRADVQLPARYRVSELASASIGRAGQWLALYAGASGPVLVDQWLASRWFQCSFSPLDWSPLSPWDVLAGDYRTATDWIRLHTNAAHHRRAALASLDLAPSATRATVAAALAERDGEAVADALVAAGGCAATLRSPAAWRRHPQGAALAAAPWWLSEAYAAEAAPLPAPSAGQPLAGLRVLDLTRVLAGPVAGRFLAGYGAEVLRIDPPQWSEPGIEPDVTLGKCCAGLDLRRRGQRAQFESLLAGAQVLLHGLRPGALARLGYPAARRRMISPGLVDVSLNAWGWQGPWVGRRGFDSLVQMATGIALGADGEPDPLPVQALDHATGYLLAAAVLAGLVRRRREGVSVCTRLSLAATAGLLARAGAVSATGGRPPVDQAADWQPVIEHTAWGPLRRLRPALSITATPCGWLRPARPLRSDPPRWPSPA